MEENYLERFQLTAPVKVVHNDYGNYAYPEIEIKIKKKQIPAATPD